MNAPRRLIEISVVRGMIESVEGESEAWSVLVNGDGGQTDVGPHWPTEGMAFAAAENLAEMLRLVLYGYDNYEVVVER